MSDTKTTRWITEKRLACLERWLKDNHPAHPDDYADCVAALRRVREKIAEIRSWSPDEKVSLISIAIEFEHALENQP